jgi:hypothetical protein
MCVCVCVGRCVNIKKYEGAGNPAAVDPVSGGAAGFTTALVGLPGGGGMITGSLVSDA